MFFLAKCVIAILLVCVALDWRIGGATPDPTRPAIAAARGKATAKSMEVKAAPSLPRQAADTGLSLMRAGVDALPQAAREKCMTAPADCLALARRLHAETMRQP